MLKTRMGSLSQLLAFCLLVSTSPADAQQVDSPDGLWRAVSRGESNQVRPAMLAAADASKQVVFVPRVFRTFDLSPEVLSRLTERARTEEAAGADAPAIAAQEPAQITLPMPDGNYLRFDLIDSPVMSDALAAKFPQLKSFRGQCLDDPSISMRMDISPGGLRAQVLGPEGTVIIDPTGMGNRYLCFNKRNNRAQARRLQCLVEGRGPEAMPRGAAPRVAAESGDRLRTYRIAVACTGEYAATFGGTVDGAMAAIQTTINRVTGIYERETAIRLELVDENEDILFTNPSTDPFTNDDAYDLIYESQTVIDDEIGDANYDIGHTFSTGAGGLASPGVGVSGVKARGVTGQASPFGDPFDVDYVAHEIGHQFSADHTFNGVLRSCSAGNRNPPTAVEPGSGSTILAYAGICSSDNLQLNSDPYFHSVSLDQIITYSTVGSGNVVTPQPTGNGIPEVNAGADHTIPKLTPFKLTASGRDPDGDDLLYCWEQRDLGPAAAVTSADDGSIPLFRSFNPTPDRWRVFPSWSDILNQTQTTGEQLPSKPRTMHFRVTVRDNRSGGGGVSSDDARVRVHPPAGPFRVTQPSAALVPGNLIEIGWNVAGTDQPPVDCQAVNIVLSTDGGQSFSETLLSNTPNDGKELVAVPATARNNLRVMVQSADNIFFAVNPSNFEIAASRVQVYLTRHAEKQSGHNPDLKPKGTARARKLAHLMSQAGVTHVYSTHWRRTMQTASPSAIAAGTSVETYDDIDELASEIDGLEDGSRVLVVGHSDTVGETASALGVTETISIAHDEYDNLFFVGLAEDGPSFARFKYQPDAISIAPDPAALVSGRPFTPVGAAVTEARSRSLMSPAATAVAPPAARAAATVPNDRYAKSELPVKFLEQNWTPAESLEFYSLRQGSPLMRKDFFDVLEQPDSTDLFRDSDYLARFGFLPRRPHEGNIEGYPIGFTGDRAIELNCAACHTSRLTYGGTEYWIDGSQAMTDVESWLGQLVRALKLTLADAPDVSSFTSNRPVPLDQNTKFGRFVRKLTGSTTPAASQVGIIHRLLQQELDRRQRYNDYNDFGERFASDADRDAARGHIRYGFGRLDALGAILNQASAEILDLPDNAERADAPVNYPAIWDAPQHVHVQWNGSVDNTARFGPLGRNAGQVVGVFGVVETEGTLFGYDSSINFDALERAEQLVTKLWSPPWPAAFGIDRSKVAAGEAVYRANCITCHALIDRRDPRRRAGDVLVPIDDPLGPHGTLGTDPLTAKNWNDRQAQVGPLAGKNQTLPFRGRFPRSASAKVPARDILSHVVFKAIARSFVPWRDELTIDDAHARAMTFAESTPRETLMRYKSRPLNGVWSTAPYLHNGSVLDMVELLTAPGDRKPKFRVGTTEFDPQTLGFRDDGPFELDTTLPGNSNQGHAYGTNLSAEQKRQLIEFLKTL